MQSDLVSVRESLHTLDTRHTQLDRDHRRVQAELQRTRVDVQTRDEHVAVNVTQIQGLTRNMEQSKHEKKQMQEAYGNEKSETKMPCHKAAMACMDAHMR